MKLLKRLLGAALLCTSGISFASQNATVLPTTGTVTGLQMTQKINDAVDTVASLYSGASDPGAVGAYRLWADTSNTLLKQRNSSNTGWNTIAPLGSQLLPLSGGTLAGQLITTSTSAPQLVYNTAAGTYRNTEYRTSSAARWNTGVDNSAESGSNAGSNYFFNRYSDAAAYIDSPLTISRSTGIAAFSQTPTFPTKSTSDNSTSGATTAFVQGAVAAAVPSGAVMAFNLSSCPSGWIAANGASGTPDLRGVFVRGLDNGRGLDSGRTLGSYQADALQNITGSFYAGNRPLGAPTGAFWDTGGRSSSLWAGGGGSNDIMVTGFDASRVVRTSAETRPKSVALLYCVKS